MRRKGKMNMQRQLFSKVVGAIVRGAAAAAIIIGLND
jgi:hypothetical protein